MSDYESTSANITENASRIAIPEQIKKVRNEYHKRYRATVVKENEIIEAVKKITVYDKDDERMSKTIQIKTFNGNKGKEPY